MISKIRAILQEPFPQSEDNKVILFNSLLAGLVVSFILLAFRPYGFGLVGFLEALSYALTFGFITAITAFGLELFMKYILKLNRDHPSWTLWKWMLSMFALFICIAIANYLFTVYAYGLPHSLHQFLGVMRSVLLIGVFPISLFGLLTVIRASQQNQKIASAIQIHPSTTQSIKNHDSVKLPFLQSDKYFEVELRKVICIEAMQNYIQVYYLNDQKEITKTLVRNTISNIESLLEASSIKRSHRSFLLNTERIHSISGNAQGLKVEMTPKLDFGVPVSRKYIPYFKNMA